MRSRQKRKCWVSNLETRMMAVNNANKLLQNEVLTLRSELAELKLQLLAHKDCSVTLALMQQARGNNSKKNLPCYLKKSFLNLKNRVEILQEF